MRGYPSILRGIAILAVALAAPLGSLRAAPPPVEAYAALPLGEPIAPSNSDIRTGVRITPEAVTLSPDGKSLAMLAPSRGEASVVIWPLEAGRKPVVIPTAPFVPVSVVWKSAQRLLVRLETYSNRGGNGYEPTFLARMIAVDADGGNIRNLVPEPSAYIGAENKRGGNFSVQEQGMLVSRLDDDPEHILLGVNEPDHPFTALRKTNVNDGGFSELIIGRDGVSRWFADSHGVARLATGTLHRETIVTQVRNGEGDDWHIVNRREPSAGDPRFIPVAFSESSPQLLYVLSDRGRNTLALYTFDTARNEIAEEIAAWPQGNIETWVSHERLIAYTDPKNPGQRVFLDPAWAKDQASVDHALPDRRNTVIDRVADGSRVLVFSRLGNGPGSYWLIDRTSGKPSLTEIVPTYEGITEEQVTPTKTVFFKARDGLRIPALLTLPPQSSTGPIPFVVLPHGGPTTHDAESQFNYTAQFLASCGYGVLQPQFRGSTGFGDSFQKAGFGQWGLSMQDDITDGTHWLIDQKLAIANRIAIIGSGYGGYAALMGVIKEPGLYAAAAAFGPVTDLSDLLERTRRFRISMNDLDSLSRDGDVLAATSPARHADRISTPVLIMHGQKDYTVPVSQTEAMEAALKAAGKPAQVIYLPEGDHYLSHGADRLAYLRALDQFLAPVLQGAP